MIQSQLDAMVLTLVLQVTVQGIMPPSSNTVSHKLHVRLPTAKLLASQTER